MRKQKVLFLCTQNSARSQMAEGFLRHHGGEDFDVYSAGISPSEEIHTHAVEVMQEAHVDISDQYPKNLKTYMGKVGFNYAIIVCERNEEDCPKTFPGVGTTLLWPSVDPRGEDVPEDEMLHRFREVRDRIEQRILDWLEDPETELREQREQERQRRQELFDLEASAGEFQRPLPEPPV